MSKPSKRERKALRLQKMMDTDGYVDFKEYLDGLEEGKVDRIASSTNLTDKKMRILQGEIRIIRQIKNYLKQAKDDVKNLDT